MIKHLIEVTASLPERRIVPCQYLNLTRMEAVTVRVRSSSIPYGRGEAYGVCDDVSLYGRGVKKDGGYAKIYFYQAAQGGSFSRDDSPGREELGEVNWAFIEELVNRVRCMVDTAEEGN